MIHESASLAVTNRTTPFVHPTAWPSAMTSGIHLQVRAEVRTRISPLSFACLLRPLSEAREDFVLRHRKLYGVGFFCAFPKISLRGSAQTGSSFLS